MECEHEWEDCPMMMEGKAIVFCGVTDDIKQEKRVKCKKCDMVDYVVVEE